MIPMIMTVAHMATLSTLLPRTKIDMSDPKSTCKTFAIAVRNNDYYSMIMCMSYGGQNEESMLHVLAVAIIAKRRYNAALLKIVKDPEKLKMMVDYNDHTETDKAINEYINKIEKMKVVYEGQKAHGSINWPGAVQSNDLPFIKVDQNWKIDFKSIERIKSNMLNIDEDESHDINIISTAVQAEICNNVVNMIKTGRIKTIEVIEKYHSQIDIEPVEKRMKEKYKKSTNK